MNNKWVVFGYDEKGECIVAYRSSWKSESAAIDAIHRMTADPEGFALGAKLQLCEFICVRPIGNMFAQRLVQLEQARDSSPPHAKLRLGE